MNLLLVDTETLNSHARKRPKITSKKMHFLIGSTRAVSNWAMTSHFE